jgi:hypothetical protein
MSLQRHAGKGVGEKIRPFRLKNNFDFFHFFSPGIIPSGLAGAIPPGRFKNPTSNFRFGNKNSVSHFQAANDYGRRLRITNHAFVIVNHYRRRYRNPIDQLRKMGKL